MGHQDLAPGHYAHFEPEQAYHASKLGMWFFLVTEVLLFGGLFVTFAIYRWRFGDVFDASAAQLDWKLGALNTIVLLASSYFMVRGVDAAQKGNNKKCRVWLDLTLLCGAIFMVIKYIEYTSKFSHGIFPDVNIFWGLYFGMTGLHGIHVVAGMGVIFWLRCLTKKDLFSTTYYTPVEVGGLYWHLVDVIWIYLFPVVYLLGASKL